MKMQKLLISSLVASSLFLVGCGDDKSPSEIAFEQKKELMAMEQAHIRELARIETQKVAAANQVSDTYNIENEYEQAPSQSSYSAPQETQSYTGSEATQSQAYQESAPVEQGTEVSQPAAKSEDSGFGAGSMLLAAAGGALAGYAASEMLSNGMQEFTDSDGNTKYYDKKTGKEVSKSQYETAKKTSKVTKIKDAAKTAGTKTKELAKKGVDKTKQTYNNVKASPRVQKAVTSTKYQAKKVKVLTKKAVKKAKRKASRKRR
jgi:hypothetical protein